MKLNLIIEGKALEVVKTLPDKSIDAVITSPPYWMKRDYQWDGQWGMEPTFQMYLENLWRLMDEIYRVLKDTGTVWINLGDTYGTKSGNFTGGNMVKNKISYTGVMGDDYTKDLAYHKCLLLIPHRFAIGCTDRNWTVRNDLVWAKRNSMPESVTDRFSVKKEYFFFMVKSDKYYFDLESIKDRTLTKDFNVRDRDITKLNNTPGQTRMGGLKVNNYETKNPGDVSDFWDIPTKGNKVKHYAAYTTKLIDKPIMAGCPKGGIILDPFCGTATTGCRAIDLQRKFIGIEGKPEYVKIGNKKLLPFQITQQLF